MKKNVFFFTTVLSSLTHAEVFPEIYSPVPYWCEYGSWKEGSIGTSGLSADYLKIEAPTYVLKGSEIRLKGDGKYLVNKGDTIYFYDSTTGYLGKREANTEGNAYFSYSPKTPSLNPGKMWVMKKLHNAIDYATAQQYYKNNSWPVPHFPPCSQKDIYFQDLPAVTSASVDTYSRSVSLAYEVDYNSKANRENIPSKITIKWTNGITAGIAATRTVDNRQGTISFPYLNLGTDTGIFKLTAVVFDGNFESNPIEIGSIATPCKTGASTTHQVQPNTPQVDVSKLCGGYHCKANVTVIPSGPFPKLVYTCQ